MEKYINHGEYKQIEMEKHIKAIQSIKKRILSLLVLFFCRQRCSMGTTVSV